MITLRINIFCTVILITIFNCANNHAFPNNAVPSTSERVEKNAVESNEVSRTKRQLNVIQSKIIDIVHPKPIVDTLREEDKYGNTVEHTFGKNIVKAVENLSNVINAVFAFPIDTVKKVSRTATDALNNLGGKLVGLQ